MLLGAKSCSAGTMPLWAVCKFSASFKCILHVSAEADAKENEPAAAEATAEAAAPGTDADMTEADPEKPAADETAAADGPSKTNYQMSVKTDEKSAAVNDSQAGDASTHQKSTEVKAAAQVEEGTAEGNSPGAVGKLDVHLTYLWQVHRVNFYVGGAPQANFPSNRRSVSVLTCKISILFCELSAHASFVSF